MTERRVSDEELDRLYEEIVPESKPGPHEGPSDEAIEEAAQKLFRGRDPYAERTPQEGDTREVTDADLNEAYWALFQ